MENLIILVAEQGVIGGAFLFMLWQSHQDRKELRKERTEMRVFLNDMKDNYAQMSHAIIGLMKDVEDIKDDVKHK